MADSENATNKKPAPPEVTILKKTPLTIKRPLVLIENHTYAAAWPYVRITITESKDQNGKIVKHKKPKTTEEQVLAIVREDGVFFSDQEGLGNGKISDSGIHVNLPMIPPEDKVWSSRGFQAYLDGNRTDPLEVFMQITEIISCFIDFDNSLADQQTMAEMITCYILATWFIDAFNVIGFLWPNGEKGSGKTQLLIVITEIAYLGQLILAGGSFAALRDMADYGATLGFDDAENISDPRRTDPDKRSLMLAGNRRGNTVPFKIPVGKRGWEIRFVNTFCPRLFSAISLPDPVLASRTITVPLIRTSDRDKANTDPSDHELWPHDKRLLIDDLWALGLAHSAEIPSYERLVNERASLSGRALEPWKAILAVALWLEDQGLPGIWARIDDLAVKYQLEEHQNLQTGDLTHLIIQALVQCAINATKANSANTSEWFFTTAEITNKVIKIANDEEVDIDTNKITPRKVGMGMGKLRFKPHRPDGKKPRGWLISKNVLEKRCLAYGIAFPSELNEQPDKAGKTENVHQDDGTNGRDGTDGTSHQVSLDDLIKNAVFPDISNSCYACGTKNWKARENGDGFFLSDLSSRSSEKFQ